MHRCWAIPDIVICIVQECRFESDMAYRRDKSPSHTLNALARTCRALQEPSLSALWYRQDSLVPLIKCLPHDLWEARVPEARVTPNYREARLAEELGLSPPDRPREGLRLTLTRIMTPADWVRFDHYARRVRRFLLYMEYEGLPYRSEDVLETFRAMKGQPILPNLTTISFDQLWAPPCDIIKFIACVAPASLSELDVGLQEGNFGNNLSVTLPALAVSHPSVRRARLHIPEGGCDLNAVADTLSRWRELRVLELCLSSRIIRVTGSSATGITFQALTKLGFEWLPHLNTLKLTMGKDLTYVHDATDGEQRRPIPLHTLRALTIEMAQTSFVTALLKDTEYTSLRELNVAVLDIDAFHALPTALQAHGSLRMLEVLSICSYPPPDSITTVTSTQLHPLTNLHRLRSLSVSVHHIFLTISTGDDDWERFACAWPRLQHLSLVDINGSSAYYRGARTRPTLLSLVHLARQCPELESVTMSMKLELEREQAHGLLPQHDCLKQLNLAYSTCTSIRTAATSLARMFPQLDAITRHSPVWAIPGVRSASEVRSPPAQPWGELLSEVMRQMKDDTDNHM